VWWVEEGKEGVKKDHLCDLDHFGKLAPPPTAKKKEKFLYFFTSRREARERRKQKHKD